MAGNPMEAILQDPDVQGFAQAAANGQVTPEAQNAFKQRMQQKGIAPQDLAMAMQQLQQAGGQPQAQGQPQAPALGQMMQPQGQGGGGAQPDQVRQLLAAAAQQQQRG